MSYRIQGGPAFYSWGGMVFRTMALGGWESRGMGCHSKQRQPPTLDPNIEFPSGAGGVMADFLGKLFEICAWMGIFYAQGINERGGTDWREKTYRYSENHDLGVSCDVDPAVVK